MAKSQSVHRGSLFADVYRFGKRQTRPKSAPRICLRICSLRSLVLIQALKSCINGHPFQASADTCLIFINSTKRLPTQPRLCSRFSTWMRSSQRLRISSKNVCARETNCSFAGMVGVRLMRRISRPSSSCVSPRIGKHIRQFAWRPTVDFSPPPGTITGSMKFSHARWRRLVSREMCSFA